MESMRLHEQHVQYKDDWRSEIKPANAGFLGKWPCACMRDYMNRILTLQ